MLSIVLYTRQEGKGLNGNSCTESHIRSGVFDRWEQERIIQGIWIAGFQNPMATICRNSQPSKPRLGQSMAELARVHEEMKRAGHRIWARMRVVSAGLRRFSELGGIHED